MEHIKNTDPEEALRCALRLSPKEAAVLTGLLGGLRDARTLRMAAEVASHGALRKHVHRLRCKLPRGGVNSSRLPTRYWLTDEATSVCRGVLGSGSARRFEHEPHEQDVGGIGGGPDLTLAPSARFDPPAGCDDTPASQPCGPVRVVRVQNLAASDQPAASPEAR